MVIAAKTLDELERILRNERKGLKIRESKLSFERQRLCALDMMHPKVKSNQENSLVLCLLSSVGVNLILCPSCKKWVHKKCPLKILLTALAQLLKYRKMILQEMVLLMLKNLKLYQHSALLEVLLDPLAGVLMLPLLVFAKLGRLSMNFYQNEQI